MASRRPPELWWRKPDCLRHDVYSGSDLLGTNVYCGATVSSYAPHIGVVYTNDAGLANQRPSVGIPQVALPALEAELKQITLLQPPFSGEDWQIEVNSGEQAIAGRSGYSIEARRRTPGAAGGDHYWDGFDLFTAIIDTERSVPLRVAAVADGQEAARSVMRSVRFDVRVPDEVFRFKPPPGTKVMAFKPTGEGL